MLNIVELERRWLRYKIKSYIPLVIISMSLLIIFASITMFLNTDKPKKREKSELKKIKKEVSQTSTLIASKQESNISAQSQKLPLTQPQLNPQVHTNVIKLSPSLEFIKRMQNSVQPYYKNESHTEVKKAETKEKKEETITSQTIEQKQAISMSSISIEHKTRQNDISRVIKRFKKNNNPALSLFVAKKYYELGNYKQAYNYSLITNQINKDIESSWIIFAKSLVKLHKKEKALSTLQEYTKHSHSSSAQILYNEIRSGKFK